jgi:hypothetical protein
MRLTIVPLTATVTLALAAGCDGTGSVFVPSGQGIVVSVAPFNDVVPPGTVADFQAILADVPDGVPASVRWTATGAGCSGDACGTLVELGPQTVRYTAPAIAPVPSTVVLRAISDAEAGNSGVAYVTVGTVPIVVTVVPIVATTENCGSVSFSAAVVADTAQAGVVWSLEGALCEAGICGVTIPGGRFATTYMGPCSTNLPLMSSVTIRATSVSDPSRSATAQVTVLYQ